MERLTISELAKTVGLNPPTIRYYEQIGLLPPPRRSEAGYRLYSQEDVQRLRLIQRAKLLSLSLEEVKEIIGYALDGSCIALQSELLALLQKKLAETQHRIAELTLFHEELSRFCDDLSARLASGQGQSASLEDPCHCLGEEK